MGHFKVVGSNNEVYGRVPVGVEGELKARAHAQRIVDMRRSMQGNKSLSSPTVTLGYTIVFDSAEYPFSKI